MKLINSTLVFLCFLVGFNCFSQRDKANKNRYVAYYSKHSFFVFYDIIRQTGVGYTYSRGPYFEISTQLGYINPNMRPTFQGVNDFYVKRGFAVDLCPKLIVGSIKGFYIGAVFSYQRLGYKNKWVEQYPNYYYDYSKFKARSDLKSNGYCIMLSFGTKHNYKHINFETFISIGGESNYDKRTWYDVNRSGRFSHDNISYPYSFKERSGGLIGLTGIRIGLNKEYKKVKVNQYYNNYASEKLYPLVKLYKQYRKHVITKQQMKQADKARGDVLKESYSLFHKHFLEEENIIIDELDKKINAYNNEVMGWFIEN